MNDGANKWGRRAKLTKPQLVAKGVLLVEVFGLIPIVFAIFILAQPLSSLFAAFGSDLSAAPSLWFLHDQYDFLIARGFDPSEIGLNLQLFRLAILISIPVAMLRLTSGPLLFGVLDYRAVKNKVSAAKLIFGVFFSLSGCWLSTDIRVTMSIPKYAALISTTPYAYYLLVTIVFIGGVILSVELLLMLIAFGLMNKRDGAPLQQSTNTGE